MFNIIAVDSAGTQWRPRSFTIQRFGYTLNGGCDAAAIKIPNTRDLPAQLDRLEIWDNLTRLWFGQVEDIGTDSNTGEKTITALGYSAYLKEIDIARHWIDTGYRNWSGNPPVPWADSYNVGMFERDNNNRLFMRQPIDVTVESGYHAPMYYSLCHPDKIDQAIFSVTFDYVIGEEVDTGMFGRLYSHDTDLTNTTLEWDLEGDGTEQSGSEDIEITAGQKAMQFRLHSATNCTASTENLFVKITNIRVNGLTGFEVADTPKADDFIKDILTNSAAGISTDVSDIAAGTYTMPDLYEEGSKVRDLINRVNEVEDYHWGIYEISDTDSKPRMRYQAIDRGTVDYTLDQTMGKLKLSGSSLENVYNAVRVWYQTPTGRAISTTRTTTVAVLDDASRTKTAEISVNTESEAKAQEAGDVYLAEHGRPKIKGSFTATGTVYHNSRGFMPAWYMRPGEIVHIRDHDPTPETLTEIDSANVLNGRNVFMITAVEVDPNTKQVRLELDVISNRLDLFLARQRIA